MLLEWLQIMPWIRKTNFSGKCDAFHPTNPAHCAMNLSGSRNSHTTDDLNYSDSKGENSVIIPI
jgi:hypothetical protein